MAAIPSQPRVVKFGVFEVDLLAGEVRKAGMKQKLAGQPFQVLQALLEHPQEIVTREELRERIWPGNTFVDYDLALKKAVNRLREMLGDSAESPHFIETVPRRGYRFIGTISSPPSLPPDPREPAVPGAVEVVGRSVATPPASARSLWKLIGVLTLGGIAALLFWFGSGRLRGRIFAKSRSVEIRSIAVLPLENLSRDPSQDYFSDGITEALTTRSGDRVRITAQLIDAHSDQHLWARTYERDLKDILGMQDEVARDIATEIRIKLTPQEQSRLTAERRTSPRAYDAYLRGRYLWSQRNAEATAKAEGYFREAVREDPDFAPAYSGLSDCYWVGWGAKVDLPLAEQYARKALSLQQDLAEGHASLGIVRHMEYQSADAEQELRRALELNPNYAMAHHFYSGYLLGRGLSAEAQAENDRARQLDPFSLPINTMRGLILINLRQYDQAIDQFKRTAEVFSQSPFLHIWLARICWVQGRAVEAIAEDREAETLAHAAPQAHDQEEVAKVYEKSGLRAARLKSAQLMERYYKDNHEAVLVAFRYGTLEDGPKVLQWLEEAFRIHDGNFPLQLKTSPEFDFLRADPRFQDLLRRAGLPQGD